MNMLSYRRPDSADSGCGSLFLQTIAGFMLSFLLLIAANALSRAFGNFAIALISLLALGLAAAIFLALRRRPGYLIGFLIASSIIAGIATTCGMIFH